MSKKDDAARDIASKLSSILLLLGTTIKHYSDLYDAFSVVSSAVSLQQAMVVQLMGELIDLMPDNVREEMRKITVGQLAKQGIPKQYTDGKSLEHLIREILGDSGRGDDAPDE